MNLKKKEIPVTLLITAALVGLIIVQIYLLKESYDQKAQLFDQNVMKAVQQTAAMHESNEAVSLVFKSFDRSDSVSVNVRKRRSGNKEPVRSGYSYSIGIPDTLAPGKKYVFKRETDSIKINGFIVGEERDTSRIYNGKDPLHSTTFSMKSDSLEMKYFYNLKSDSVKGYSSFEYRVLIDTVRKMDSSQKNNLVSGIVDRLLLFHELPPEKRIERNTLDSLLNINLHNSGINIPYSFGVINVLKDSAKFLFYSGDKNKLETAKYRTPLYPSESFIPSKNILVVNFPETGMFIYKQILPQLLLSLLFMLIIISGFFYTIRTLMQQKRFGNLIIDFVNNMTHEFKTPLATIALASEAINKPETIQDEEKVRRYNKIIEDENVRIRSQVDKILEMAVLEKGDYELNHTSIDIHTLLCGIFKIFTIQTQAKEGKINYAFNADNPVVKGDLMHLNNIFSNLLDNAVKYSDSPPDIFVSTENTGNFLSIKISDKGIGIKEDDLTKVFDKYYRVPTGNRHDNKGFGLGLSYVKLMVGAHKGDVKISSRLGEGTLVEVLLPLSESIRL